MRAALAALLTLWVVALPAWATGIPAPYAPVVVQRAGAPERAEFDITPAVQRARREGKRLYLYLGADDCRYCRRYEAFLERHAAELQPHFAKEWLVVDLRSSLSVRADQVFITLDGTRRRYDEFQQALGDERARRLVYPNVWLLDAQLKPLMPMPSGTGTFETVPEQLEILRLQQ